MRARPLAALAIALAGCGPYADVGQKLDVGMIFASGETWIAAPASGEIRLLVLGRDAAGQPGGFALSSLQIPYAAGRSARTLEGTWSEATGALLLVVTIDYEMPYETGDVTGRRGSTRSPPGLNAPLPLALTRGADTLGLSGDPAWTGTYVRLQQVLPRFEGRPAAEAATCAFQLANLAVLSSQARIIGFGSAGMLQYGAAQDFVGTLSGKVNVHLSGGLTTPVTDISYQGFSDFPGVELNGVQTTFAGIDGSGHMEGTVTFTLQPDAAGGAAVPGAIVYGVPGGADNIRISGGHASSGGHYQVTLGDAAAVPVDPVAEPPTPPLSDCLGLP
jgi:hypothetical protein